MKRNPKNFYTQFLSMKSINDLIKITDYITDRNDTHLNHSSDNHKTIVFDDQTDVDRKLRNIINISNFHTTRIKLNRKGGKPSSPATSIMISLPEIIGDKKISLDDIKKLHHSMIRDEVSKLNEIYKLNFTPQEEKKFINMYVISSIHFKDNNPHLNIIIPSVVETFKDTLKDNKKVRARDNIVKLRLGLKKFSYQTKLLVEKNMFKLGYSLTDYVIKKVRENKKLNPIASIKQDIKDERKKQIQFTHNLEEENKNSILEMQQLQQLFKEMEFLKDTSEKLHKRINNYLNRMATALQEDDTDKYIKNEELANKSYNKLSELVNEEHKEKMSKFEELKKSIEAKRKSNTLYPAPTINKE
nr:hypothetical protein [uncultured Sulfurimonas sp.]